MDDVNEETAQDSAAEHDAFVRRQGEQLDRARSELRNVRAALGMLLERAEYHRVVTDGEADEFRHIVSGKIPEIVLDPDGIPAMVIPGGTGES